MPQLVYILLNRTVRSKFTAACHVQHSHPCPAFLVTVSLLNLALSCCVGLEVSQDKVGICSVAALRIQKRIVQIAESSQ